MLVLRRNSEKVMTYSQTFRNLRANLRDMFPRWEIGRICNLSWQEYVHEILEMCNAAEFEITTWYNFINTFHPPKKRNRGHFLVISTNLRNFLEWVFHGCFSPLRLFWGSPEFDRNLFWVHDGLSLEVALCRPSAMQWVPATTNLWHSEDTSEIMLKRSWGRGEVLYMNDSSNCNTYIDTVYIYIYYI